MHVKVRTVYEHDCDHTPNIKEFIQLIFFLSKLKDVYTTAAHDSSFRVSHKVSGNLPVLQHAGTTSCMATLQQTSEVNMKY